ncbi:unnamed protein product, partial [Amoebophrya sp. A25]|eukprot:GSA25T00023563001.1
MRAAEAALSEDSEPQRNSRGRGSRGDQTPDRFLSPDRFWMYAGQPNYNNAHMIQQPRLLVSPAGGDRSDLQLAGAGAVRSSSSLHRAPIPERQAVQYSTRLGDGPSTAVDARERGADENSIVARGISYFEKQQSSGDINHGTGKSSTATQKDKDHGSEDDEELGTSSTVSITTDKVVTRTSSSSSLRAPARRTRTTPGASDSKVSDATSNHSKDATSCCGYAERRSSRSESHASSSTVAPLCLYTSLGLGHTKEQKRPSQEAGFNWDQDVGEVVGLWPAGDCWDQQHLHEVDEVERFRDRLEESAETDHASEPSSEHKATLLRKLQLEDEMEYTMNINENESEGPSTSMHSTASRHGR